MVPMELVMWMSPFITQARGVNTLKMLTYPKED